jgi:hypothetical protein
MWTEIGHGNNSAGSVDVHDRVVSASSRHDESADCHSTLAVSAPLDMRSSPGALDERRLQIDGDWCADQKAHFSEMR